MKKNSSAHDDVIDLTMFFRIIWYGKIKILLITTISFLIGIGYNFYTPINYLNSLNISPSQASEFVIIEKINEILKKDQSKIPIQKIELNKSYQDQFIKELADYEEFLLALKKTKKVQAHISKVNIEDQELELFKYVGLLEIVRPKTKEESYTINFLWDDSNEAKLVMEETLNHTLKNFEKNIYSELSKLLEFEKNQVKNNDKIRLDYLTEQSAIAKELQITDNQIDNVNLSHSSVSLNINTADIAYYLRGYKAIDKEIELIKNRNYKNLKFLENEIESLKNNNFQWVEYNVHLMESKLLKNNKKILTISILLGLIVGLFYVLISNFFQSKKMFKKTN